MHSDPFGLPLATCPAALPKPSPSERQRAVRPCLWYLNRAVGSATAGLRAITRQVGLGEWNEPNAKEARAHMKEHYTFLQKQAGPQTR